MLLAVPGFQEFTADDFHSAQDHPPGQGVHVDAELGGDASLFLGLDPLQPGIDVDSLPRLLVRIGRASMVLSPRRINSAQGCRMLRAFTVHHRFHVRRISNPRRCRPLRSSSISSGASAWKASSSNS